MIAKHIGQVVGEGCGNRLLRRLSVGLCVRALRTGGSGGQALCRIRGLGGIVQIDKIRMGAGIANVVFAGIPFVLPDNLIVLMVDGDVR